MTTTKKAINYEVMDKTKTQSIERAVKMFVLMAGEKALAGMMKKKYAEDIIEAVGTIRYYPLDKKGKEHFVEGDIESIIWNNRTHGCVCTIATRIDGDSSTAEITYDKVYADKDGHMVFEVIEDLTHSVAYDAYNRACEFESKN